MVDRRCATIKHVVRRARRILSMASLTCSLLEKGYNYIYKLALCSDAASSELVASSRAKIAGFFSSARAIARRCLCPPLKLRRPTTQERRQISQKTERKWHKLSVSNPFGIPRMNSQFASRAAASMFSRVTSLVPKAIFDAMVPVNRTGSCAAVVTRVDAIFRVSTCLWNDTDDATP